MPADLVKSTVSTFANDRLQVIQQRVMTSQHLNEIIDRFSLYPGEPEDHAALGAHQPDALAGRARGGEREHFRPAAATALGAPQASIAFTLSFESEDPNIAQQVANRLTDLYLAENDRTRQEKAAGTTQFLTEQAEKLYGDVQSLEKRLLDLRSKYNGSLPEQFAMNTQLLNQAQGQLMQNRSDLQLLTDRKSYLQSQLGTISPYTPMTANGRPATPQAQLMSLELQYSDLSGALRREASGRCPPAAPDRRAAGNRSAASSNVALDQAKLGQLQAQLNDALQRYGEKHPDVQRLRRQLDEMSAQMSAAPAPTLTAPAGPAGQPDVHPDPEPACRRQFADPQPQRAFASRWNPTSPSCRSASCRPRPSKPNTARCRASTPSRFSAIRASRTRKPTPKSRRTWSSRARARPSP